MNSNNSTLLNHERAEVIEAAHLERRLATGEKLRIKLGIDPSRPDLHLGHAVPLRKLRQFQEAGHTAILIIGDYTAQIGDPTDRSEARKTLSPEEVKQHAAGYLEQANKILDPKKTEVHFQSEWFGDFSLRQVIELMASVTVNHLLSHETFAKRFQSETPLHGHEILYPLLQGYDSVMVRSDVEIGGVDQKFNLLMGRIIQRAYKQPEQDVIILPYLPGTDGKQKMSKSLGNTINLNDDPGTVFGKVMSIPDALIIPYFELATSLSGSEIDHYRKKVSDPRENPRDSKVLLAKQMVTELYGSEAATQALESFEKVFKEKKLPENIEILSLKPQTYEIVDLLAERTTLVASKSEARRLISQLGIKKNKVVSPDIHQTVTPEDGDEVVIQVGPLRFIKIVWKP